jgi:hypothetical protein
MFGTILIQLPLLLAPQVQLPIRTVDCQLEVFSPQAREERALAEFEARVNRYVSLHRRLERGLPPEQMFDDWDEMGESRDALADAIRAARPHAGPGDVFSPGFREVVTTRVRAALARANYDLDTVLAAIDEDVAPGAAVPTVNDRFPWQEVGAAMWPALLRALPPLPRELEYRFVKRSLVLVDLHADLVVDVLDDALPAPEPAAPAHQHVH